MAAINITFPKTNIVGVKYNYRTFGTESRNGYFDKYDHIDSTLNRSENKEYYFRLPKRLVDNVHVGDAVVVHTQYGFKVAEITTVNSLVPDNWATEFVVDLVDMESYREEIDMHEKREVMKQQILAEKKRLESMVTFQMIAEKNPEFKQMLDAFTAMGGTFD